MPYAGYPPETSFYIGGNDLAMSGVWVWSRGSHIEGFQNWARGYFGVGAGHCMEIRLPTGKWHKTPCSVGQKRAFIGERGRPTKANKL